MLSSTSIANGNEPGSTLLASSCPLPLLDHEEITLAHGSGGKLTHRLIEQVLLPQFQNEFLSPLHDGAIVSLNGIRTAFSTDSFVVDPLFFPGGDIGKLAVYGTVNDLAMCGAKPLYLSASLILEEGFKLPEFCRVIQSMRAAADLARVKLVTGDTKVVDRGKADKIFINTAGIGIVDPGIDIRPTRAQVGDKIIINGPIGDHGIAVMLARGELGLESEIASDAAPLNHLVAAMLRACPDIHVLRDPTRGGLASSLNEIAGQARVEIRLIESAIPVRPEVRGACEILGFDPLYVANEGKVLVIVSAEHADQVLTAMRSHPGGKDAAIIGEVTAGRPGTVLMKSRVGGTRVVDMLSGEQLPRIC